jgi:hypothetical protein
VGAGRIQESRCPECHGRPVVGGGGRAGRLCDAPIAGEAAGRLPDCLIHRLARRELAGTSGEESGEGSYVRRAGGDCELCGVADSADDGRPQHERESRGW